MTELRYWERVGFMVTRDQAEEIANRMNSASGKVLDEDMEEFVEARTDLHEVLTEITILFENPPSGDKVLSDDNKAIIALMDFESNKKAFIMERKAEGMDITEAKEAYEAAKAGFVREALGLPEPETEEE